MAGPASAHASFESSDPAEGAVLPSAPATITLTFSEPVSVPDDTVKILNAAGARVPSTTKSVDNTIVITPKDLLAEGTSIVSWRVTSADSHPVAGGFSFSVDKPSATSVAIPSSDADPYVELVRQIGEGARYLLALAAAGLVVFGLLLAPSARRRSPGFQALLRRVSRLLVAGASLAAVLMLPVTQLWQDGRTLASLTDIGVWSDALRSTNALSAAVTIGALGVALLAFERSWIVTAVVAATAAAGGFALVGHTRSYGNPLIVSTADVVHLSAAALWIGGLVGLCLVLIPRSDLRGSDAAEAVSRFSAMALWTVGALAVAGGLLWWQIPRSISVVSTSGYGRLLAIKVVLVVVVVTIAAWNRRNLVPAVRANRSRTFHLGELRRTVAFESAIIVGVLLVTGVMVTQPPREAVAATSSQPSTKSLNARLGDDRVTAKLTPGAIGINAFEVTITDAAGKPVQPIELPQLTVAQDKFDLGPFEHPLSQTGPGRYEATIDLPLKGLWTIRLTARLSEFEEPTARMLVTVK
ncbi:copper resistance protein CopC [soil metagenome]